MDFDTLVGLCGLRIEEFARAGVSVGGWERPSVLAFANLARLVTRGRQANLAVSALQLAGAVLDLGLGRSCEDLVGIARSVIDRLRSGERAAAEELWQYVRSCLGGGDAGDEPDGFLERLAQQDSWFRLLMGMRWKGELSPRVVEPIVGNGVWLPRGCTAPGVPEAVTVTSLVLTPKAELREAASRMRSVEVVAVALAAPAVTPRRDLLPQDLEEAFLAETSGLVDRMEQILLECEGKSAGPGSVNELFRLAHSVKGNSGAVGLGVLADLAHVVEDVLDRVRSGHLILDTHMITALLVAVDCMRKLTSFTEPSGADVEQALACALELAWYARPVPRVGVETSSVTQASPVAALPEVVSSVAGSGCLVEWRVPLDEPMPYARAVQVVSELRRHVKVTAVEPPEGEWPDLRPGAWIKLRVAGLSPDELSGVVERMGLVGEVRVNAVHDHGGHGGGSDADLGQAKSAGLVQGEDTAVLRRGVEGIRVSSSALDELLGLVGETLSDTHRVAAAATELLQRMDAARGNGSGGVGESGAALRSALGRLEHTVAGLQRQVLQMRLVSLRTLFVRYHRIVRDACLHLGKEAQLLTEGEDVQVDKQVIELLSDPLTHLIRNAIDHGIEPPEDRVARGKPRRGTVWLRARSDGGHVVVEVCDDGRGIDLGAIRERARQEGIPVENLDESSLLDLIFRPGFSCARSPTRYSGRGVGLDVVRSNLAQLRGSVTVTFKPGCGTTFYLRIPASTAITRLLLVRAGHATYGIPLDQVREVFRAAGCPTTRCGSVQVVRVRGRTVPLCHLANLLLRADTGGTAERCSRAVLVQEGESTVAIGVDDLCGIVDSVVRPVQVPGGQSLAVSGAALLGDGRVVLVVDGGQLVRSATGRDGLG
jgi:two-component system chemotaxis sensor kinase CheA